MNNVSKFDEAATPPLSPAQITIETSGAVFEWLQAVADAMGEAEGAKITPEMIAAGLLEAEYLTSGLEEDINESEEN